MTKIYAFLGKNTASIDIPVGPSGSVHVEFTGGNIYDRKNFHLATTACIEDPVLQAIIENSPFYGNEIILYEERESESETVKETKEYPDVTNFAEACAILKSEYEIKAAQLRSPTGVRTLATNLGVSFPNWN